MRPQSPEELYDPAHLLEFEIEVSPEDYAALREEGYSLFEFLRREAGNYPYIYFRGDLRIDGALLQDVALRKKGGLGSLSRLRPSQPGSRSQRWLERCMARPALRNERGAPRGAVAIDPLLSNFLQALGGVLLPVYEP